MALAFSVLLATMANFLIVISFMCDKTPSLLPLPSVYNFKKVEEVLVKKLLSLLVGAKWLGLGYYTCQNECTTQ